MTPEAEGTQSIFRWFIEGGFAMWPLLICSLIVWGVIFERVWKFRKLARELKEFHMEAVNTLLRGDVQQLRGLCTSHPELPTAKVIFAAIERLSSNDERLREKWIDALERKRQMVNQDLKQNLWVLGTIGAAAPFIGLFGTVVGILRSFNDIAKSGSGGFAVVAAGISEALIATATGIVVAVVAVMAYNALQSRWSRFVLLIKHQLEEVVEILGSRDLAGLKPGKEI